MLEVILHILLVIGTPLAIVWSIFQATIEFIYTFFKRMADYFKLIKDVLK